MPTDAGQFPLPCFVQIIKFQIIQKEKRHNQKLRLDWGFDFGVWRICRILFEFWVIHVQKILMAFEQELEIDHDRADREDNKVAKVNPEKGVHPPSFWLDFWVSLWVISEIKIFNELESIILKLSG